MIESQNNESKQNYTIYKTILQLLKARGYLVLEEKEKTTFEEFEIKLRQRSNERDIYCMLDESEEGTQASIAVFFNFRKEKITENYISEMIKQTQKHAKNFFVVVGCSGKNRIMNMDKGVPGMISDLTKATNQNPIRIQLFKDQDLLFNILDHDLVPKHKLLKEEQKQDLLKKYKVKQTQLPKILLTDPVAKFLGLRRGQVVKIIRKSQTAGTYTTYRIAV